MKINIRILILLLALALGIAALVGCSTTGNSTGSTHDTTGSAPSTDGNANGTPSTGEITGGTPSTDEITDGTPSADSTAATDPVAPSTETTAPDTTPDIPETSGMQECSSHTYGSWTIVKDATCDADGMQTRTCSKCGDAQQETIRAIGHSYGSWETTKTAVCETEGTRTRKCSRCGVEQSESVPATGHSYGNWTTTKAATCDINGVRNRKCSKCGDTQQEVIPAAGHAWDEGKLTTVPTTCSDMGVRTHTCTVCGKTKVTQVKGNHAFGDWQYEEYQYTVDYGKDHPGYVPGFPTTETYTSHRKVRKCTRCGYTENGGTPDHICERGSDCHKVSTVKEGICGTPNVMRSTCTICGWYEEYEGKKGPHTLKEEWTHLTDYTEYTNELDQCTSTCVICGSAYTYYILGKGYEDNNKYYCDFSITPGNAYMGVPRGNFPEPLQHPEWQMLIRNFVYDDSGYVIKCTVYWWYNGQRYSQVLNCGPGEIEAWFAECGMTAEGSYTLRVFGTYIAPYKVSWTG